MLRCTAAAPVSDPSLGEGTDALLGGTHANVVQSVTQGWTVGLIATSCSRCPAHVCACTCLSSGLIGVQGPAAERAVAAAGLVPDAKGRYRLACPACRSEVVPEALLPPPPLSPPPAAEAATATSEAAQRDAACSPTDSEHGADGNQAVADSSRVQLPPQQMAVLRAQQAERRAGFERQRQQVVPCREILNHAWGLLHGVSSWWPCGDYFGSMQIWTSYG